MSNPSKYVIDTMLPRPTKHLKPLGHSIAVREAVDHDDSIGVATAAESVPFFRGLLLVVFGWDSTECGGLL